MKVRKMSRKETNIKMGTEVRRDTVQKELGRLEGIK